MKNIIITPRKLEGKVRVPSSKSIAHRAIICAALSNGKSVISGIDFSDDIEATINAIKILGARVTKTNDKLEIYGNPSSSLNTLTVDCNESGSTLRFLIPIILMKNGKSTITGKEGLAKRPLDVYIDIFKKNNIKYNIDGSKGLKLEMEGRLKSGEYSIRGDLSSQFVTGLMFALPMVQGDSIITIEGKLESKAYIDLTMDVLDTFGIKILNHNYQKFTIKGNQRYRSRNFEVESDYSQGAFFLVANQLGNKIEIQGLKKDSKQGDKAIIDIIDKIIKTPLYEITEIDGSDTPDIVPIAALAASFSGKKIKFINILRLRIKESDRITSTVKVLSDMGYDIYEENNEILINLRNQKQENHESEIIKLSAHNDHRIAMMAAVASTVCSKKIEIDDRNCVNKSYPDFWNDFSTLGGIYE